MTATLLARREVWRRRLRGLCFGVLGLFVLVHLAMPVLTIAVPFERNYNEGWNAYHAARVVAGEPLYIGNPLTPVNYPFVSFYLTGLLSPGLGGVLTAGRLLSLLSLAVIGLAVGGIVRRLGGQGGDAAVAALAALGFWPIQATQWTAVDDPQALGQALMTVALLCHVWATPTKGRLLATALLVVLAGFTKHNLVAIPIAITLDLAVNHRRLLPTWCWLLATVLLLFLAGSYAIAGGNCIVELLTPRDWHWVNLIRHTRKFVIAFEPPILAAILLLSWRLPTEQRVLLRTYGISSFATSTAFAGGDGVSFNIFLDTTVFLAISVGLSLNRWRRLLTGRPWQRIAYEVLPVFLLAPLLLRSPDPLSRLSQLGSRGQPVATLSADFIAARELLAAHPGPVICESLLLCWSAGKPLVLDPFNSYQLFLGNRLAESGLLAAIARRDFTMIQVRSQIRFRTDGGRERIDLDPPIRFTNDFYHAVLANYELATSSVIGAIYVPSHAVPRE